MQTFGEEGTAELINLVGFYCLISVILNGFDVPGAGVLIRNGCIIAAKPG